MKLLKNIFIVVLALALTAPAFAQSAKTTDPEEQRLSALIDDTVAKRDAQVEKFKKFHEDTKARHTKKLYGKRFGIRLAAFFFVYPPVAIALAVANGAHGFESRYEKSKANYEKVKQLHKEHKASDKKAFKAEDKFIDKMTALFLDDPAVLLDTVAARKDYFFAMRKNEPKVVEILENYNAVLALDLDTYSDYAVKKLAHADANTYYEELLKYAGIKTRSNEMKESKEEITKKELINEIKEKEAKSKARRVAVKEIKKDKQNQNSELNSDKSGRVLMD